MSDGVKRMHVPIVLADNDGTWFVACHACSHEAKQLVVECTQRTADSPPWPPYNLREDVKPERITPDVAERLSKQFDEEATPEDLRRSLFGIIEHNIMNRPRSLQKEIGPSEIGGECGRKIAYKLAKAPVVNPASLLPSWRTQVGVFVHGGLADWMTPYERFAVEQNVTVGSDGDDDIRGSGDLYDAVTASVVDYKIVGPTTLKSVKAKVQTCYRSTCQANRPDDCSQCGLKQHRYHCEHIGRPRGASEKYEIQTDLYGVGYESFGLRVNWTIVAFLPAAGDLSEAYFHVKRYDRANAERAIARLAGIKSLLNMLPLAQVAELTTTADEFCTRCEWLDPQARDLGVGCPGHAARKVRVDSLVSMIPTDEPELPL